MTEDTKQLIQKTIKEATYDDLKDVREHLNARIKELEHEAIKTLHDQAARFGFTLLKAAIGMKPAALKPPTPKYVNPDNPEETYSGRGRKPAWLEAKLAEGAELDHFRVQ